MRSLMGSNALALSGARDRPLQRLFRPWNGLQLMAAPNQASQINGPPRDGAGSFVDVDQRFTQQNAIASPRVADEEEGVQEGAPDTFRFLGTPRRRNEQVHRPEGRREARRDHTTVHDSTLPWKLSSASRSGGSWKSDNDRIRHHPMTKRRDQLGTQCRQRPKLTVRPTERTRGIACPRNPGTTDRAGTRSLER